uniref:Uncharacterized protein n=1 Tax=Vespula pensylvanica TaxID=30213 RepID=A0A834P7Z3_VESPE|nr:hypothetical protein H0235_004667 [Vespula pensylvanica]
MPSMIVKNSEKEKTHWNVLEFVNGRGRGRQASRQAGWLAAGWLVGWLAGWLAGRHPFRKHFWKSPHVLGLRKSPNVRVACPHHEAPVSFSSCPLSSGSRDLIMQIVVPLDKTNICPSSYVR